MELWITLVEAIPPVVQGAIIGALIALSGTWLQNRGAYDRLKRQLEYEDRQGNHDRAMNLKREVLLEATDALAKLQEYIASAARLDIDENSRINILQGSTGALAKVQLVGNKKTFAAFAAIREIFARETVHIADARMRAERVRQDVLRTEQMLNSLETLHGQASQALASVSKSSVSDVVESRLSYLEKIESAIELQRSELATKDEQFRVAVQGLIVQTIDSNTSLANALAEVALAGRDELEQPTIEDFEQMSAEVNKRVQAELHAWHQRLGQSGKQSQRYE